MFGLCLVAFVTLGVTQGHLLPSKDLTHQQLRHYFTNYKSHTQNTYSFCLYINANAHRDISNWFIKHNSCSSVLPGNLSEVPRLVPPDRRHLYFPPQIPRRVESHLAAAEVPILESFRREPLHLLRTVHQRRHPSRFVTHDMEATHSKFRFCSGFGTIWKSTLTMVSAETG
jgi:hypothetical protein